MKNVFFYFAVAALGLADKLAFNGSLGHLAKSWQERPKKAACHIGLDASLPMAEIYREEQLLKMGTATADGILDQVVEYLPNLGDDEASIVIELIDNDFVAEKHSAIEAAVLDRYKMMYKNTGIMLFDGKNARLVLAEQNKLVFQGCSYFDYIMTNLSLDVKLPSGNTLRGKTVINGKLVPLISSPLANSTGVNGLIFSADGYLLLQRRNDDVLIRPREICPGFSGTIDKSDFVHSPKTLAELNVCREMVEEVGIHEDQVTHKEFLGITRELFRGGAPEMFYAVDISLEKKDLSELFVREKEGDVFFVPLGNDGKSILSEKLTAKEQEKIFEYIMQHIQSKYSKNVKISLPLQTNLALWLKRNTV